MKKTSHIIGRFTEDKFVRGQASQPCDTTVCRGKLVMDPSGPDILCFGKGPISFNLGLRVLTGAISAWLYRNGVAFQPFVFNPLAGDNFVRAVVDVADAKQGDKFSFNFAPAVDEATGEPIESTFNGSMTTFDVVGHLK